MVHLLLLPTQCLEQFVTYISYFYVLNNLSDFVTTDREWVGKWDLKVVTVGLVIKCSSRKSVKNHLCHLCGQKGETVIRVVCE